MNPDRENLHRDDPNLTRKKLPDVRDLIRTNKLTIKRVAQGIERLKADHARLTAMLERLPDHGVDDAPASTAKERR